MIGWVEYIFFDVYGSPQSFLRNQFQIGKKFQIETFTPVFAYDFS